MRILEGFLLHLAAHLARSTQLVIRDDPNSYFCLEIGGWSGDIWW
jgi:hypothetical protein